MYAPAGVKTNHNAYPIPDTMRAWVLGDPGQLSMTDKPTPVPKWTPASEEDIALARYAEKVMEVHRRIDQEVSDLRPAGQER